jgi:hypothetical protein
LLLSKRCWTARRVRRRRSDQQADTIYHAIVEGWAYKKGNCAKHSSVAGTKCGMECMHNPTDGMVHWHEHAMKLLTEAVANRIVGPGAPVPPELLSRSWGRFTLGGKAYDYQEVTLQREKLHASFMDGLAENPEKYSPVVVLPGVEELWRRASLAGRSKCG